MSEDFFDKQDRLVGLVEKVGRLCGEKTMLRLPPMSLAETEEDLDAIESAAKKFLRQRSNQMARIRYRKSKPPQRGRWSHRQVFTMFLREYGADAKNDDAWRHFKSDNEIVQCDHCGGYSNQQDEGVTGIWSSNGDYLLHFCDELCAGNYLILLTDEEMGDLSEYAAELRAHHIEQKGGE